MHKILPMILRDVSNLLDKDFKSIYFSQFPL